MKTALVITYYWPPSGGAGVQRWLKFVKYLPGYGVKPVVLTVDESKASYPVTDPSLLEEVPRNISVYRTGTREFYSWYRWLNPKKELPYSGFANEGNPSFLLKLIRCLRGNLFIPDPRRGWNKSAIKQAEAILRKEKIDCIITSSPPHSSQLIGLYLKSEYHLPWIADLRDPWTDIYYYRQFRHLQFARNKDAEYERTVLEKADHVIVVSEDIKRIFSEKSPEIDPAKIIVIPNGYDEDDFLNTVQLPADRFILTYTGTLSDEYDISGLIEAMKNLQKNHPGFPFLMRFTGTVSSKWRSELLKSLPGSAIGIMDYVPHGKAVQYMLGSHGLLLIIPDIKNNAGILTGKLFEYLAAQHPILCLGPVNGDAATIIKESEAGRTFAYNDAPGIYSYLVILKDQWQSPSGITPRLQNIGRFSRKSLTGRLAEIINS